MKLNDEELNMIAGGSEAETAELGKYLYARFPECFRNPDKIELGDVYDCLLAKVPGFRSFTEPGDDRTNMYTMDSTDERMTHDEFMDYLQKVLG